MNPKNLSPFPPCIFGRARGHRPYTLLTFCVFVPFVAIGGVAGRPSPVSLLPQQTADRDLENSCDFGCFGRL